MLAGCNSTPTTTVKEAPKPIEPATGQSGLYKMYQVARSAWSADAQVLTCTSVHLTEVPQAPDHNPDFHRLAEGGRVEDAVYCLVERADGLDDEIVQARLGRVHRDAGHDVGQTDGRVAAGGHPGGGKGGRGGEGGPG